MKSKELKLPFKAQPKVQITVTCNWYLGFLKHLNGRQLTTQAVDTAVDTMSLWPFGAKLKASVDMLVWPIANLPTWWGAGSVKGGTGAGSIAGATGLSLVEGPFQLPPPLDAAVLLTEILEDLLCRRNIKTDQHFGYSNNQCHKKPSQHRHWGGYENVGCRYES